MGRKTTHGKNGHPSNKITAEDAYRLLIGSVIEFLNTAMLVESEITKYRLQDNSDDLVPGTARTHRDMWGAMKTVSHFNFGIALELMLKLLLYAHGKDVEKWHNLSDLHDDLPLPVQEELDATYRSIRHKLIGTSEIIAHISLPPFRAAAGTPAFLEARSIKYQEVLCVF